MSGTTTGDSARERTVAAITHDLLAAEAEVIGTADRVTRAIDAGQRFGDLELSCAIEWVVQMVWWWRSVEGELAAAERGGGR